MHDNHKFDAQWKKIENQLREKCDKSNISSIPNSKFEFLTLVFDLLDYQNILSWCHLEPMGIQFVDIDASS